MNKKHWITIDLSAGIDATELEELVKTSRTGSSSARFRSASNSRWKLDRAQLRRDSPDNDRRPRPRVPLCIRRVLNQPTIPYRSIG